MTAVTAAGTGLLTVAEVFPAWQGEGPRTGQRCVFIRLGGCNLTCGWQRIHNGDGPHLARVPGAWACDEAKTWHSGYDLRATLAQVPAAAVLDQVLAAGLPLAVITGGEPLLHQDRPGWQHLLGGLLDAGRTVEIETNGTLTPAHIRERLSFNVSPKLASSGLPYEDRIVTGALAWHAAHPRSVFKFVAATPGDVDEAAALAAEYGIPPGRTWIMPEGVAPARVLTVASAIAPAAAARGFNLTLRQHVLIYGEQGEPR